MYCELFTNYKQTSQPVLYHGGATLNLCQSFNNLCHARKSIAIKSCHDMSLDLVVMKGMADDSVKRLMMVDHRFNMVDQQLKGLQVQSNEHSNVLAQHTTMLSDLQVQSNEQKALLQAILAKLS